MSAQGMTVTSLCVGETDFGPPPAAVWQAIHDAVNAGDTRYTAVTGTLALRQAIAQELQQRKGSRTTLKPKLWWAMVPNNASWLP